MTERPILFSAPMVRAILNGTKTKTRRIVKNAPEYGNASYGGSLDPVPVFRVPKAIGVHHMVDRTTFAELYCPYGKPGDTRLWVRETWGNNPEGPGYVYRADGDFDMRFHGDRWRPSIHMPRWASRITLEVVSVRVERLQDITWQDIQAEGITTELSGIDGIQELEATWIALWTAINGPGSWDANPFVWVVEFRKLDQP